MQIFPRSLNKLPLVVGAAATSGLVAVVVFIWYYFSPWFTQVGYSPKQPVPYSHRLHVGQLRLEGGSLVHKALLQNRQSRRDRVTSGCGHASREDVRSLDSDATDGSGC